MKRQQRIVAKDPILDGDHNCTKCGGGTSESNPSPLMESKLVLGWGWKWKCYPGFFYPYISIPFGARVSTNARSFRSVRARKGEGV